MWHSLAELTEIRAVDRRFSPAMEAHRRAMLLRGWHRAVERSKGWASPD
jgi:glycerol kinase